MQKDWYQNRMETSVTHRGQNIPKDKKLYLSEEQAKIHNANGEKVAKTNPPENDDEVGVLADLKLWEKDQQDEDTGGEVASPPSDVRQKSSLNTKSNSQAKKAESTNSKDKSYTKAK